MNNDGITLLKEKGTNCIVSDYGSLNRTEQNISKEHSDS